MHWRGEERLLGWTYVSVEMIYYVRFFYELTCLPILNNNRLIFQVCNAVYVRLNYTQPLCACPQRWGIIVNNQLSLSFLNTKPPFNWYSTSTAGEILNRCWIFLCRIRTWIWCPVELRPTSKFIPASHIRPFITWEACWLATIILGIVIVVVVIFLTMFVNVKSN